MVHQFMSTQQMTGEDRECNGDMDRFDGVPKRYDRALKLGNAHE